jgi:hypothetical protein
LFITSLFLLFAPPNWLSILGVDQIVAENRGFISLICLFSGASFFVTASSPIIESFTGRQFDEGFQNGRKDESSDKE